MLACAQAVGAIVGIGIGLARCYIAGMHLSPDAWITVCTDAFVQRLDDPHVTRDDLRLVAIDLAEGSLFNALTPNDAAALHVRETA